MKRALVIMNMQNDVVSSDGVATQIGVGYAAHTKKRGVIEKLNRCLVRYAATPDSLVVFSIVCFRPDYSDFPAHSVLLKGLKASGGLKNGSWGTDIHAAIDAPANAKFLRRNQVSVFNDELVALLRAEDVERVDLCGVSTERIVQASAHIADGLGFSVHVVEDLCAASSDEAHEMGMKLLQIFNPVQSTEL